MSFDWKQESKERYFKKAEAAVKEEIITETEALIRAETERDTYKALYEQLFNKLVSGGAA